MTLEIISKINEYDLNFYFYSDDDDENDDFTDFDEFLPPPRDENDEERERPALDIYGTDITQLASQGKLDECFGREKELLEMMEILVRRQKNNPVLVGDAGVGKTAIVELFASRIVKNLVPFVLEGRTIVSLDLARIVAGSRYRGEFELRFQRVLDEVLAQPNIIIFIDEIHNIGGTGSAEGSLDAANILKPVLSRSGFQCIGATTTKEYQRIEKDPALNRRFQPIKVKEPTIDETINILYGLRPSLEAFHNIEIVPGAIRLAAELSARYIHDRFLPDKAIDLLDRAAAKEVIRLTNVTEGSVIGSFVNSSLNSIGTLRVEAFRRGDIGAEFIFQEIENAYRNFLLQWLEDPSCIPEASTNLLSPISEQLFTKMRLSVLRRVDELLFASINPSFVTTIVEKTEDLSPKKNQELYWEIKWGTMEAIKFPLSLYRISVYLFSDWIESDERGWLYPSFYDSYLETLQATARKAGFLNYIRFLKDKLIIERTNFKYFTLKDEVEAARSQLNYYVNEGLDELIEEHRLERIEAGLENEPINYPIEQPYSDDDGEEPTSFRTEHLEKQELLRQLTIEVEAAEKNYIT